MVEICTSAPEFIRFIALRRTDTVVALVVFPGPLLSIDAIRYVIEVCCWMVRLLEIGGEHCECARCIPDACLAFWEALLGKLSLEDMTGSY